MSEILKGILMMSWGHLISHLSFFSGVSILLPQLSSAWHDHVAPWLLYPNGFWFAATLIVLGMLVLFIIEKSISKLFRIVGWMLLIPGIIALLFTAVGSDAFYEWGRNSISGFATVEPGVEFLIHHQVPSSVGIAAAYILLGLGLMWTSGKLTKVVEYI